MIQRQAETANLHEQFHSQVCQSTFPPLLTLVNTMYVVVHYDVMCVGIASLQLTRSMDGFGVVADYFGRGVFNKVRSLFADIRGRYFLVVSLCMCKCTSVSVPPSLPPLLQSQVNKTDPKLVGRGAHH